MSAPRSRVLAADKRETNAGPVLSKSVCILLRWSAAILVLGCAIEALAQEPDAAYRAEFKKWQQEQVQDLKENWLPLIGLFWLKEGANTFGAAKGNAIELPASSCPAQAGVLALKNGVVTIKVADGAKITTAGKPVTELKLVSSPPGPPTRLEMGSLRMAIIQRGERYGLRVRDMNSPAIAQFKGLQMYPLSTAYIVTAQVSPGNGRLMTVPNVIGDKLQVPIAGELRFKINGQEQKLDAMEGSDGGLFIVFSDLTKKRDTYPGGRFVETSAPKDGKVVLDFNKAYSPPCAWTPYATCPLPPKENQMRVEIPAGEKYSGHQ